LARTALKDQEITDADVMAGDGDGVGSMGGLDGDGRADRSRLRASTTYGNVNFFPIMMMMTRESKDTISGTVKTMSEGVVVTIFIVVTHLVLLESRRIYGLFGNADLFTGRVLLISWFLEARRIDGLLCVADLFSFGRTEAWGVNSSLVDSDFFTIVWLETRSVFTLAHVNLSLVLSAATMRNFDGDICIVVSSVVWEFDVDVCRSVSVVGSSILTDVDIFSAARTVVTILFASYVNFFLTELLVARRKIGLERRVLTFPSDALLSSW